tara:strand:- start:7961 stop:8842 length:882 start_codon:yes stop_codon:yes gene_type:complete
VKRPVLLLAAAPLAAPAHAHMAGGSFSWWLVDPLALVLLLAVAWAYWRGSVELAPRRDEQATRRLRYFWIGWGVLTLALASPLDPLGEELFSAHMVQHELMMLVAAPLLVLSRPSAALLRGSPGWLARGVGASLRLHNLWRALASPLSAWLLHALVLWGWHLPALFSASLESTTVHILQHLSFLWVGLLFWWALWHARRRGSLIGVLYLFTTAIHASALGALLTFSPEIWYPPYLDTTERWGLSPLADQQLGGLIMWMPAGLVFIGAGLAEVSAYLRESEQRVHRREQFRGGR